MISYMGNREENISCIPKTSLTDLKDKSRTKFTLISFFFHEKLCIGLVMYDFIMLILKSFQDKSNCIFFADIHLEIRGLYSSQFSEL